MTVNVTPLDPALLSLRALIMALSSAAPEMQTVLQAEIDRRNV